MSKPAKPIGLAAAPFRAMTRNSGIRSGCAFQHQRGYRFPFHTNFYWSCTVMPRVSVLRTALSLLRAVSFSTNGSQIPLPNPTDGLARPGPCEER